LQEARRVSTTVAATLGFRDESDASLGELAGHLKAQRTLIVLDNCEHVIDAAVESIETLLANCAALKVVATSREALGVAGEQVFAVRSLSLPATAELDDIRRSEAVRLFVDHARLVLPDFDVDERNAVAIVRDLPPSRRHRARHRAGRGADSACSRSTTFTRGSTTASAC
jgi:non-specific serine/threonine protein kinase